MEILLIAIVIVILGFVVYTNINKSRFDTNKDGKVDVAETVEAVKTEVKAVEQTVKVAATKAKTAAKTAAKKATTRKPKSK